MACYHPLKAWPIGTTKSGKINYKVTSYNVDHLIYRSGQWICVEDSFLSMYREKSVTEFVEIPCGRCIGCRLEYSRQWANRCMLELEYHKSAYFVTLTYDDKFVPTSYYSDLETAEALPSFTLSKRDVQLFLKRVRKRFSDQNIRFFCAGEYGPKTFRPHYHLIMFGLSLSDLEFPRFPISLEKRDLMAENSYSYYTSLDLQRCWSCRFSDVYSANMVDIYPELVSENFSPMGHVIVAPVNWETCAYVARYVTKKLTGDQAHIYDDFNIIPPFTLMSRKPGIGRQWYDDHPDCFDYEYINLSTPDGGLKFRPPRYYRVLYDVDEPEISAKMKETRKRMAIASKNAKLDSTSLSYLEMLAVEESNLQNRIKSLIRR